MYLNSANNSSVEIWIGAIRVAPVLAIMVSHLIIAGTLFRSKSKQRGAYWVLGLLAAFVALCALREIAVLSEVWRGGVAFTSPAPLKSSALKILAAIFWVFTAWRLPAIVERLSRENAPLYRSYKPDERDHEADLHQAEELSKEVERLTLKARMLQVFIQNESWLLDKFDVRQELIGTRDDGR